MRDGDISIPVSLLPAQYYEAARQARLTSAERRLLVAVFALAWADLVLLIRYTQAPGLTFPGRRSVDRWREELVGYFFGDNQGIYSLAYFCWEFGLDLGEMRQAVAAYAMFPRPLAKNEHYLHPASAVCIRGHNANAHNELRRRDGRRCCRRCLEEDRPRPRVNRVAREPEIRIANLEQSTPTIAEEVSQTVRTYDIDSSLAAQASNSLGGPAHA